jgi:DNA-binding MarR family transcriptional regulator
VSKPTNPSKLALCIMIAGDDHRDGVLLERIMWWWKYASLRIPKKTGEWIANKHEFWKKEARLSPDQLTRSLKRLESKGLIERTQYWFRGRNILYLRPTAKTVEFLQAATTWSAADELIADVENHTTEISKSAKPTLAKSLNCNKLSKIAESTSADLPNSNYIKTKHKIQHKEPTSGSSAPPTYPGKKKNYDNEGSDSENMSKAEFYQEADGDPESVMSVAGATTSWIKSVKANCPSHPELKLSAKQKGAIALIAQSLGEFSNQHNKTVSVQVHTADILDFGISHWAKWKSKSGNPDPETFYESLENIVNDWIKAGCPPYTATDQL